MTYVLIKRTYTAEGEPSDRYVLAGTHDECAAKVERMKRSNPGYDFRQGDHHSDFWRVSPPGQSEDEDGGFFGHRSLDLLIVSVPGSDAA